MADEVSKRKIEDRRSMSRADHPLGNRGLAEFMALNRGLLALVRVWSMFSMAR
jgi:hypothetical protein